MAIPSTAEAVIIGGGINGGSIAFHLAQAGLTDIVILEQGSLASGASSLGAGIIRTFYRNDSEARLATASLATFRNWAEEIGGSCGYVPTGFLWMVDEAGVAGLRDTVARQVRLGMDAEVLSPADLVRLQPQLTCEGVGAAAYEAQGGYGDPGRATEALHSAACRLGARLCQGVTVQRLLAKSGRICGVVTTEGEISAPLVVLAAGAWSGRLAATVGVEIPQVPTRMTTGTIRHAPLPGAAMTFIDTVADTFWRPTGQPGVAHVSIRDARHNTAVDPDTGWKDEAIDPAASVAAIRRLAGRMPALVAQPQRAWAGIDGVTPDTLPILGGAADMAGLILCAGSSYKGFKIAPAVGRCLAEMITTGRSTSVDLTPFALARFVPGGRASAPPAYNLASVA